MTVNVAQLKKRWENQGLIMPTYSHKKAKIVPFVIEASKEQDITKTTTRIDFEEYVTSLCEGIDLDEANKYADRGASILEKVSKGEALDPNNVHSNIEIIDNAVCILWSVIRDSFLDSTKKGFGKGMILFHLENDERTKNLFKYLHRASHNRTSSHYGKQALIHVFMNRGCRGMGKKKNGSVQWPFKFRNLVFNLIMDEGKVKMFFKPEQADLDFSITRPDKFIESLIHAKRYGKSNVIVSKAPPGTEHYGEKEKHGHNPLNVVYSARSTSVSKKIVRRKRIK